MHEQAVETLIIGGGISGLACARHLQDANIPFTLITDRVGGRLALSVNIGPRHPTPAKKH